MPVADEEHFRLLGGFNDVFITLAIALLLFVPASTGLLILMSALCWGLAEVVTRQRRLALPSVVLAVAFALGIFAQIFSIFDRGSGTDGDRQWALLGVTAAVVTGGAAFLYWRRFRVPVTQALIALCGLGAVGFVIFGFVPGVEEMWWPIFGLGGVAVFAYAMWWDLSDRERQTQRADVAFWLHLVAAPLVAHSVFQWASGQEEVAGVWAVASLLLYGAFAAIALIVDRRAILVSGLGYALAAVAGLIDDRLGGWIPALLFVGSALLLLGLFWTAARAKMLALVPEEWRRRLPPARAA